MNDENSYLNYFSFLKNLKNHPDTGLAPLMEWQYVIRFFVRTLMYLDSEWGVDVDGLLNFDGCKLDEYPKIYRHKQSVADIVVAEFRRKGSVNNAAMGVLEYLRSNGLIQ